MEKSKNEVVSNSILHECVENKRKINAKNCDGGEPSVKKSRATDPSSEKDIHTNVMLSDIKCQLTVMLEKMSSFEAYVKESKAWMACVGNKIISMEASMNELNERILCDQGDDTSSEDETTSMEFLEEFMDLDPEVEDSEDCLIVNSFHTWHEMAISVRHTVTKRLPVQVKTVASAAWFNDILNPKGWLNEEHVHVLLNLIIFKAKFYTASFLKDWTMLDMIGTGLLMQENFELVHSQVLSYVQGSSPREGARSWVKASRVVAVAKISKNYWVCLEVSFELQRITVYDSMFWTSSWSKVKEALKNMTRTIPWICKQEKIWEKKGLKTKLKEEWELVPSRDAKQLRNYYDCGVMSIKFAECLVSSDANAISTIDPERCGVYRRIFCGRLYQLGDLIENHNLKDLGLLHDLV